ncbi:MAG: cell division transport system permease protein [Candidatus Parcubacteria bacterium]|nr:cell division transport system permease protein [Candidatus Parcubacteria bacterium]
MSSKMNFKRILIGGARNFSRSGLVSFATVLIMTVTLVIIGSLIFLSAILSNTLAAIEDKVDVNVYFTTDASEDDILGAKSRLERLDQVAQVTYTSREEAITQFRTRHADDELTLEALDQLGDNPLGASLAVKATDPTQYEGIVNFLSNDANVSSSGASIIDHVNYYQNKTVIDRLTSAINATQRAGLAIVVLFSIASVIIALATVRLAIYTARDEISVMRLVGASNMYIRGPFIVAGIISGAVSGLIALALFYPAVWYGGARLAGWLGGFNLFTYYLQNFPMIFAILVGSGMVLGGIASFLGVRRYLTV